MQKRKGGQSGKKQKKMARKVKKYGVTGPRNSAGKNWGGGQGGFNYSQRFYRLGRGKKRVECCKKIQESGHHCVQRVKRDLKN